MPYGLGKFWRANTLALFLATLTLVFGVRHFPFIFMLIANKYYRNIGENSWYRNKSTVNLPNPYQTPCTFYNVKIYKILYFSVLLYLGRLTDALSLLEKNLTENPDRFLEESYM